MHIPSCHYIWSNVQHKRFHPCCRDLQCRQKDLELHLPDLKARSFSAIRLEMERGRNQVLVQNCPDIMPEICENRYVIRSN